MSSGKLAKNRSDGRLKAKNVLATLERLSSSNSPDKDQTRYLCHKLLQLVTEQQQESTNKDVTSKAGLDIILLTLESSNDQATCMALVGTLAEISRGGSAAVKRLLSHDATRVLLHTLSYIGPELDWRLLSAILQLLVKLGPKDRRFALRARLTGSLPIILNSVRSAFTYSVQSRMLPVALSVLKLALTCSSSNATLLGRAGAINILFRIVSSLSRKQAVPLKHALASLNLLVRFSRVNAGRSVKLGVFAHILKMHQDYHKQDWKHEKNCAIRKSLLNIVKNVAATKAGRKAFVDNNGLAIIYKSCRDYLEVESNNKSIESFLAVAIIILRRCQTKVKLPVANTRCSFFFTLPCPRDRSDSQESSNIVDDSDGDVDDDEGNLSNEDNEENGENSATRGGSGNSASKSSATSESRDSKAKAATRTAEDLKMYDQFFPELIDFPPSNEESLFFRDASNASDDTTSAETSLDRSSRWDTRQSSNTCLYNQRIARNNSLDGGLAHNFGRLDVKTNNGTTTGMAGGRNIYTAPNGRRSFDPGCGEDGLSFSNYTDDATCFSFDDKTLSVKKQMAEAFQNEASTVNSVKETINKLSQADAWGAVATDRVERQPNKKSVNRLIKSKVLDDLARSLYPDDVINRLVYSSDDRIYDQKELVVSENGQLLTCDVHLPTEDRANEEPPTEKRRLSVGQKSLNFPDLSSQLLARDTNKIVVNIPTHDVGSSSTTSLSDEMWPGAYMEKKTRDVDSAASPTHAENQKKPSSASLNDARRGSSANSSRAGTAFRPSLKFDSQFESGNLRAAFQVREFEYDLVLNPDCNSNHHFQWFYFEVSGMQPSRSYRFNIINCEKKGSVINDGMQPVMLSMIEAKLGRCHWLRVGRDACYYRNHFLKSFTSAGGSKRGTFFTLTFTVTFPHDGDTCYLAYHYPYTYTKLQLDLKEFTEKVDPSTMYVRNQAFCHTLSGNPVPLLTITAPPDTNGTFSKQEAIQQLHSRPYIFLTARVHPGESNASWTMRGTLRLLLTPPNALGQYNALADVANDLRRAYIFKVVPMLNPDGVINGHHRCSLTGEDLNRTWLDPNPNLFPTIYHTKGLLQYLHLMKKAPHVYCDYHGHSRKMNVFLYGCSRRESIAAGETTSILDAPSDQGFKTLPKLLDHFASSFSLKNCSFVVEKSKVSTARVVVWKEFAVARSYTMESTYCGCDQGPLRGRQIGTRQLEDMGSKFCEVLLHIHSSGRDFTALDSEDEDVSENLKQTVSVSKFREEDRDSVLCPVNSDAELTPDDDNWNLDEAFGFFGSESSNENDNNSSFRRFLEEKRKVSSEMVDYAFWRYDPTNASAYFDVERPMTASDDSELTSDQSTLVAVDDLSQDTNQSSTDRDSIKSLSFVSGRVSPATGRVYDLDSDQVPRTAPRPFESGLVLKKSPRSRSPKNIAYSLPTTSAASKVDAKLSRGKKRSGKGVK